MVFVSSIHKYCEFPSPRLFRFFPDLAALFLAYFSFHTFYYKRGTFFFAKFHLSIPVVYFHCLNSIPLFWLYIFVVCIPVYWLYIFIVCIPFLYPGCIFLLFVFHSCMLVVYFYCLYSIPVSWLYIFIVCFSFFPGLYFILSWLYIFIVCIPFLYRSCVFLLFLFLYRGCIFSLFVFYSCILVVYFHCLFFIFFLVCTSFFPGYIFFIVCIPFLYRGCIFLLFVFTFFPGCI